MRKLLALTLLISLFAMPALALDFAAKHFYIQGEVAFPMGDFGDISSLGYGGGLGMMVPHNEAISFGLEASYLTYSLEDFLGDDASFSMIPVLVLMDYNFTNSKLYALGGLGMAFSSFDNGVADESSSDFAVAVGAGFNATPNLFFEGRYNFISDAEQVTAHIGYRF